MPGPEVCETVYDEECSKVPFEDCKVNDLTLSLCFIKPTKIH